MGCGVPLVRFSPYSHLFHIGAHHDLHQAIKADGRFPAENLQSFCGVSEKQIDLCRAVIFGVDLDDGLSRLSVDADFIGSLPFPNEIETGYFGGSLYEFPPVATTKSSGPSCCSISHMAWTKSLA